MDFLLGLKLFTTNTDLLHKLPVAWGYGELALFSYLELYVVPGTAETALSVLPHTPIPVFLHAPHHKHGLNLADKTARSHNSRLLEECRHLADALHAPHIIVHGGHSGSLEECILQVKAQADTRFVLENTPLMGHGGLTCVACTPTDCAYALASGAFGGLVLDVGHARIAANNLADITPDRSFNSIWPDFLYNFLALRPVFYHFMDGDAQGRADSHAALGEGSYPLREMLTCIPKGSSLTLETPLDEALGFTQPAQNSKFFSALAASLA